MSGGIRLDRLEQMDMGVLSLYTDWHYLSPVVFAHYRLERLERLGLVELQWRGDRFPKRYGRLTDAGRELADHFQPARDAAPD